MARKLTLRQHGAWQCVAKRESLLTGGRLVMCGHINPVSRTTCAVCGARRLAR